MKMKLMAMWFVLLATGMQTHAADVSFSPATKSIGIGELLELDMLGSDFPATAGATLGLQYDPAVLQLVDIRLAVDSPFDFIDVRDDVGDDGLVDFISLFAPFGGTLPSNDFRALTIAVRGLALGTTSLMVLDDGGTRSWSDVSGFNPIATDYSDSVITVTPAAVPLPAAAWLLGSGLLPLLGFQARRGLSV